MSEGAGITAWERKCGALAHALPLVAVPVVWWCKRRSAYVAAHARAAVNFRITMLVFGGLGIGYVQVHAVFGLTILVSAALLEAVSSVLAARRAWAGEPYEYRVSLAVLRGRGAGKAAAGGAA